MPELERFRQMANFTTDERELFEYRSKGVPLGSVRGANEHQHIDGETAQPPGKCKNHSFMPV